MSWEMLVRPPNELRKGDDVDEVAPDDEEEASL